MKTNSEQESFYSTSKTERPDANTKVVESGQEGMARMSALLGRILHTGQPTPSKGK